MAFQEVSYQLQMLVASIESLLQNIIGKKNYTNTKRYALRHPFVFTAGLSIAFFSALPLLVFLGFILITLAIALVCFFCIEGSLIAISGLIFVGVLSFITVTVGFVLSGMAVAYWVLQRVGLCLRSCTSALPCVANPNNISNEEQINDVHDNSIENITEESDTD